MNKICESLKVIDKEYDYKFYTIENSFKHERKNIMEVINRKHIHIRKGKY